MKMNHEDTATQSCTEGSLVTIPYSKHTNYADLIAREKPYTLNNIYNFRNNNLITFSILSDLLIHEAFCREK